MLSMICKDVRKEQTLSTTPDINDDLWVDIKVRSFWQRLQTAFVDVRVYYPFAPIYQNQSQATTMKTMENQKKRKYNRRILDGKNGSSLPLCLQPMVGWAQKQNNFRDDSVNCYVKNQMLATVILQPWS